MADAIEKRAELPSILQMPRNVWAAGLTSFFMDVSSEMVTNILPLFLANVLGVQTSIIGLIEGNAETTASILKLFSGWLSDKLGGTAYRTYNAVIGLLAFPASLIAGLLWQGPGTWKGFGPSAPFLFGATLALTAALLMAFWKPQPVNS